MADFVTLPIESTPQQMLEEWSAEMESLIEGWTPALGEYETIFAQAIIYRIVFPLLQLAANVDAAIFQEWGRQIVNVVPQEATRATVDSTWTLKDKSGYTITAGTQIDIARSGDDRVGFIVVSDVVVAPGEDTTKPGEVVLEAVEPGLDGNGLEGEGVLIDALFFVDSIAIIGASSGGADAEDPQHFLARLARTMQTYIEGVVIARDVEIVALNVPGIGRALALDNYNAETEEDEQEKTTTVAVTDAEGEPATAEAKEALAAKLEEKREVNYLFFVIDPTYHELDVEGEIVPMQGFDKAEVAANVAAAIAERFSPARHGQQPPGDDTSWVNDDTLRYQDLVTVVNNVEGVDYYSSLKWRVGVAAFGTADISLTGAAPLPRPDTITIT
jgi:uncharacterized phage protein gp47/JayE